MVFSMIAGVKVELNRGRLFSAFARPASHPVGEPHIFLFRRSDIPDACQQFVEIVPAAGPLQPVVIHGKALDDVLSQTLGDPDAKLGAPVGFYPVADGDDDVEIIALSVVLFPILGSYPENPGN